MKRAALSRSDVDFLNYIEFRLAPDYEASGGEATANDLRRLVRIARKLSGVKADPDGWAYMGGEAGED